MTTAYLSTAYLPPIHYFCKLFHYDQIVIEAHCNYVKQTYRNRCAIVSSHGEMALTIPVERNGKEKNLTRETRISDHGNWQHLHWNAIVSAYNNTPFFEFYRADFEPFYTNRFEYLFDFNNALLKKVIELIDIEPMISFSDHYQKELELNGDDFRESIHPKRLFSLDEAFCPVPYYQVFDRQLGFLPNMSIIDLLFNCGPESVFALRDSHQLMSF